MKWSLKTKFYVYILPLLVVLPILFYSLVTPYRELKQSFTGFESNADTALLFESFARAIDQEHLELVHTIDTAPMRVHAASENPHHTTYEDAVRSSQSAYASLQTKIGSDTNLSFPEKARLNDMDGYYAQFEKLSQQAISLSTSGKAGEAQVLLGDRIDEVVNLHLRPEIDQQQVIEENEAQTALPELGATLSQQGVIAIPGLQADIAHLLNHFQDSIDAEHVSRLAGEMQLEVFYSVLDSIKGDASVEGASAHAAHIAQLETDVTSALASLNDGLDPASPDDSDELLVIKKIDDAYHTIGTFNVQALSLVRSGKQQQALLLLRGDVDAFIESTFDPLATGLVQNNEGDVQTSIAHLDNQISLIEYILYGIATTILLLGIISIWKLSHDIISPIITLKNATSRLTKGDFTTRVPVVTKDEIGELAASFNDMAGRLRDLYGHLEEKVKEQTAALRVAKDESDAARAKDEAILTSIGDGVVVADAAGKFIYSNKAAERLVGMAIDQTPVDSWPEHFGVFEPDEVTRMPEPEIPLVRAMRGETVDNARVFLRNPHIPNGRHISINARPFIGAEGNMLGGVIVFHDVTQETAVDKAKTEFVSLASHQLRTPLSAIAWHAELLLDGDGGRLTKEQKGFAQQIYASNRRMIELVSSLLNVSRIDLGTLASDPVPVDLAEISNSVIDELKPSVTAHKVAVKKEYQSKKIPFLADPKLTRMILQNLISNAVKYTPPKGSVSVALSLDDTHMHVVVTDTGYGIPKDQQDKIFTKLFRADNAKEKDQDGNGLGLYIVKSVVENNGGKVWFESEENKGSTFFIDLPASGMKKIEGSKALS